MFDGLKPYPAMKESGVPWLGEVPEHWEVVRAAQIGAFLKGAGGTKEDAVDSGFPCVRYGDLYTTHQFFIHHTRSRISPVRATSYTRIQFADVLFAASGETIQDIGKSAVNLLEGPAYCGGDLIILRPKIALDARFLGYATDCRAAVAQKSVMAKGTTIKHIYPDQLKWLGLCLPPPSEQATIVRLLDYVDRRIRRYIRAKQRLIKLLEEQKQAIIHRAVTRGLDPNARLKPSGVEWLGDVPEHWEVVALRRVISRAVDGPHHSPYYLDQGVPFLSARNIKVDRWQLDDVKFISEADYAEFSKRVVPEPGDVLYTKGGTTGIARAVDLTFRFQVWVHVAVLKVKRDIVAPEYLALLLNSPRCYEQAQLFTRGATNQDLGLGRMKGIWFAVPPRREQDRILSTIEQGTGALRIAADNAFREINLLREYRTRLIADVVTGKLDVREAASRLPDEADETESPDDPNSDSGSDADDVGELDAQGPGEEGDA